MRLPSRRIIPPTPEQVTAYSIEIGYPLDGQAWCDSYAQKGWTVGKVKMKDWQAAVRNWKANGWKPNEYGNTKTSNGRGFKQSQDYSGVVNKL